MTELKHFFQQPKISKTMRFLRCFFIRSKQEQIPVISGYLSYVTLMSLVPLIVVMLSVMTAFPLFANIRETIEGFVYTNFVPTAGEIVREHLSGFVANASKMSAVAISFLILFALLLISVIDKTLNKIWRVSKKRRLVTSFSMYWMILTLGPILVGSSIAVTSYFVSFASLADIELFGLTTMLLRALPLFASIAAFLILYMIVPNKVVPFKYALAGAAVAGVLFELAKKAFALYVTQLPSYQAIYGALATIPILFVWVYISWFVVILGAVFTVSLEEFNDQQDPQEQQQKS
jgi:membrane protein